jgi:transposase
VPTAGEDARFTVYGALDYASGRVTWQTAAHKNRATFVAFLDRLAAAFPTGQVLVVLDNVGSHKSHAARRWWVAHHDRIRPRWLPAYAPHPNLIERVWRHVKDKLSNRRWWADLPALERAAGTILDALRAQFHRPGRGITLVHNFSKLAEGRFAAPVQRRSATRSARKTPPGGTVKRPEILAVAVTISSCAATWQATWRRYTWKGERCGPAARSVLTQLRIALVP